MSRKDIKRARKIARDAKMARRAFECGETATDRPDYFRLLNKGKINHVAH